MSLSPTHSFSHRLSHSRSSDAFTILIHHNLLFPFRRTPRIWIFSSFFLTDIYLFCLVAFWNLYALWLCILIRCIYSLIWLLAVLQALVALGRCLSFFIGLVTFSNAPIIFQFINKYLIKFGLHIFKFFFFLLLSWFRFVVCICIYTAPTCRYRHKHNILLINFQEDIRYHFSPYQSCTLFLFKRLIYTIILARLPWRPEGKTVFNPVVFMNMSVVQSSFKS